MPSRVIVNASQVLTLAGPDRPRTGADMGRIGLVRDGAVLFKNGRIVIAGMRESVLRRPEAAGAEVIDADRGVVLPGFVDSHTHPVFTAPRLADFESRLGGKSYRDIAADGGGILWTVDGVRGASEAELAAGLRRRARDFLAAGTTTIEAKSGYGLDLANELKILRAIRTAAEAGPLEIVSTFLGAHAVPPELRGRASEYAGRVVGEMLPAVRDEKLARFADVFCDEGYFALEDARRVLEAAKAAGLSLKVHAEQLGRSGAAQLAAKMGAASADHLDHVEDQDVRRLAASDTVACLVPGSNYFLAKPYPPARRLIDGGCAVALATDFNPGTCPCWDMTAVLSIACTQMGMTPAEAVVAATANGAWALGLGKTHGTLEAGRWADLAVFAAQDYRELAYYFGSSRASLVVKRGEIVHRGP